MCWSPVNSHIRGETILTVGFTRYLPIVDTNASLDLENETPKPGGRDILVAIKAVAVNPVDTKERFPKDKVKETPRIITYDASGDVEAVRPNVKLLKPGEEVF